MKKKSSIFLRVDEKFYSRKNHIEQKIKNINLAKNNINSKSMLFSETSENNNRNLVAKKNIIKKLSDRNINNFKNKEKYYKKLILNTSLNKRNYSSKDNKNDIIKNESTKNKNSYKYKYIDLAYNNKRKDKNDIYIRKKKFEYKHITPIKYNNNEKKIKKNYSTYDSQKLLLYKDQAYNNRTSNEISCNEMDTNDTNSKSKAGALSLSKLLKNNNSSEKEKREKKHSNNEFKFKDEKFYFENKFKMKCFKNKPPKKQLLNLDKMNKLDKSIIENDIKKKNNIILLSFRSDKRSKLKRENRISTSSEKDSKARNGALKILDLLKNKKSEKIVIKEKDKTEEERIDNENKENVNSENINNKFSDAKSNNSQSKDIYNEIIDEVKQEKNIIQKIVHRKIIQGVKEFKVNNSINNTNIKYNTRTYKEKSNNIFENPNSFSREENINNKIPFLSCEKDKYINKRILNLDIDENRNINKNTSKNFKGFKTFNNDTDNNEKSRVSNDNTYTDISERYKDDRGVKIKKIKLDKLKNKLKKNTLNYYKGDNININLNLSNKIINIHNSHRIYAPKRVSITKRPSADNMLRVPFYLSHSPDFKSNSINSKNRIYSKNEDSNDTTYANNIKPFNEITIFDSEKNNENKDKDKSKDIDTSLINNSNNNNNCKEITNNNINNNHEKENIKKILYSKVKISKKHGSINIDTNQNLNNGRCKTIRYIRKSKNKIERVINYRNGNENKIVKTQEMQFGITSRPSDRSFNILDKTEPINFNLNAPLIKQNSFIKYKTYLSNEMNDIGNNTSKNNTKKMNAINLSHIVPYNYDEQEDNFSTKKFNAGICKLSYNFSNDKLMNNITGADDIICTENEEIKLEQILPLLSFEDLLIIEDKLNLVLIVLEKGNKTYEEYFDLWNFFFSSSLKSKFEQIFKYFIKETEYMKIFVNYTLVFIMICYDFAANNICIDIDRNNFSLIEVAQIIYTNILIIINKIKAKIILDNNNNYNIRLIELSKIDKIISNKLTNIDNDILFIKELLHNNTKLIIKKVTSILDSIKTNNILNEKYSYEIFSKINSTNFEEINQFFFENVLKEDFLGCSITAYTYIKEKQSLRPSIVPYLLTKNKKKYSLILDLDETLIHFKVNHSENEEGVLKLRPGVFTFLEKVGEFYEIILFSEASEEYTLLMMEAFKNKNNKKFFDYKLYRKHCIIIGQDFIKDLSRIGRPLDKTIIIDNLAQNFKMQKSNGIIIKPFLGEDQNDQALIDLIPILINIARDEIDVRNGLMKYRDEILTKISSNLFRRNKQNNN